MVETGEIVTNYVMSTLYCGQGIPQTIMHINSSVDLVTAHFLFGLRSHGVCCQKIPVHLLIARAFFVSY